MDVRGRKWTKRRRTKRTRRRKRRRTERAMKRTRSARRSRTRGKPKRRAKRPMKWIKEKVYTKGRSMRRIWRAEKRAMMKTRGAIGVG